MSTFSTTWLVTGAAGFIGSNFVRRALQQADRRIISFDKLTYAGNLDSLPPADNVKHHFVQGDIGDSEQIKDLLATHRPHAIINFAAESHVDRSIDGPAAFVETNVVGTTRLLQGTTDYYRSLSPVEKEQFRFLHISTDEVFGSLGPTGKFLESTPYSPNSPYAASKAASDHFVRAWHHTYGLPTLITNCSNNYGPYQFPEKLIPLMTLNALEGKPLPVYGDGQNVRDWLFVEDHCDAILRVLEAGRPGETYNIGGNCERSNLEIVHTICDTVQTLAPHLPHRCRDLIRFVPDRPGHDRRYAIDATKIAADLNWHPTTSFALGIHQTVAWYLASTTWVERVTSGKYRRERLGLNS